MSSVPFRMTLSLVSPVVMPFLTSLDGLLSSTAEAFTGLYGEDLVPHIPLERDSDSGVFRASSIFLSRDGQYEHLVKVRALKHWDLDLSMIGPMRTKTGKLARSPYPKIDRSRGVYANKLTRVATFRTPRAVCYGVGNIEEIKLHMECLIGIGRFANQGQGEIANVALEQIDQDLSWVGLDGEPQRPIPVATWQALGGKDSVTTSLRRCRFPYWQTEPEACAIPRHNIVTLSV